jgi:hypothetical protein
MPLCLTDFQNDSLRGWLFIVYSQVALSRRPLSRQARHRVAGPIAHRLDAFGAALLGSSAIRTRTASKAKPGVCLAVPVQDAVVGVSLPVSVKQTSSMPKTDGCPGEWRFVAMKAVNLVHYGTKRLLCKTNGPSSGGPMLGPPSDAPSGGKASGIRKIKSQRANSVCSAPDSKPENSVFLFSDRSKGSTATRPCGFSGEDKFRPVGALLLTTCPYVVATGALAALRHPE